MVQLLRKRMEDNKECWYILSVAFGKEREIKHKLTHLKSLELNDIVVPEPLKDDDSDLYKYFLGYAFIRLWLNMDKYAEMLDLEHIYRFLGGVVAINKRIHVYIPYKISDKEMKSIKGYLTGEKKLTEKGNIRVGDKVVITKGNLNGIKGKVIEIKKSEIKILPEVFFQNIITVPITSVAHCN